MGYRDGPHSNRKTQPPPSKPAYAFSFTGLFGLCLFFWLLAYLYLPWQWPILWCLACSAAVFVVAGYDKAVAGSGALRVPEAVLFTAALLGGALGLLLAMKFFRHKTRKASFQFVLAVIIVIQVAVWRYFLMDL